MKAVQASIVLASSSVFRKRQLESLSLTFAVSNPEIDESANTHETPEQLTQRLATAKASKVKLQYPEACVIGSDQVCTLGGIIYGKPGSVGKAEQQLKTFSDNCIEFFTALCVLTSKGQCYQHLDRTRVRFRNLSFEEIQRYIEKEQPLNCAGSFKVESLGLSLFESVESKDPSALMGLPLIKLCAFLRLCGYQIP